MNKQDRKIARVLKSSNQSLSHLDDESIEVIYKGSNAWKAVGKAIVVIEKQERQRAFECVAPIVDELVGKMFDIGSDHCMNPCCTFGDEVPCGAEQCIELNKKYWQDEVKRRLGLEVEE